MGVKGLLQALKPIARYTHVSEFKHQTVAIDGYAWLHKAAFTDLNSIVGGQISDKPIRFCCKRLSMLKGNGLIPIVVFDGRPLPQKAKTNIARRELREAAKENAKQFDRQGDSIAAYKALGQAVSISWQLVEHFIMQLTKEGYAFLVAPYEADAQLGYLSHTGLVDLIISEDSDLILYGCKKVFFKMNELGQGLIVDSADLPKANLLPLKLFDMDALIIVCTLAGCDYTEGIKGVGLKKGGKLVANVLAQEVATKEQPDTPVTRLKATLSEAKKGGFPVDQSSFQDLRQSYLTFKYQTVYDPITKECVRNHTPPKHLPVNDWDFLGPILDLKISRLIAEGRVEPKSLNPTTVKIQVDVKDLIGYKKFTTASKSSTTKDSEEILGGVSLPSKKHRKQNNLFAEPPEKVLKQPSKAKTKLTSRKLLMSKKESGAGTSGTLRVTAPFTNSSDSDQVFDAAPLRFGKRLSVIKLDTFDENLVNFHQENEVMNKFESLEDGITNCTVYKNRQVADQECVRETEKVENNRVKITNDHNIADLFASSMWRGRRSVAKINKPHR